MAVRADYGPENGGFEGLEVISMDIFPCKRHLITLRVLSELLALNTTYLGTSGDFRPPLNFSPISELSNRGFEKNIVLFCSQLSFISKKVG